MGYYPDWADPTFPPEKIDFRRYDWIDFAFASLNEDFALVWDDMVNSPKHLSRLVTAAHAEGSKVKLSIGGWTGSQHFSSAVASDESRRFFANNVLAAYKTHDLDGIELDWEYPGRQGAEGNNVDSKDTPNFLLFLIILRSILPPTARISAAVQTSTFWDTQGRPMTDLTDFADVLDWVLLMNYDVWGSSSEPGPNAPLHDACGNSTQADANAVAAFQAWTTAKFPPCKLVLGVPSYGYISTSHAERLRTRSPFSSFSQTRRSESVKVVDEDGGSDSQVQFRQLVGQGALVRSLPQGGGPPIFSSSGGFERRWDSCSDTPFLRSTSSGQIITYDDPESLGMKATFAREVGMLGVNLFDIHGDTEQWDLIDSIRKSLGHV
ncbi:glycoside hydrolase family 18 protein [Phlegmacium glaucopus]|nr:glycoside hydrolase family 18 protein [Phlegmacium glaucopus]